MKTKGSGKSIIKVHFNQPYRFDDAIARHGQYVRWINTILCPCIDEMARGPDPYCPKCQGRGQYYWVDTNRSFVEQKVSFGGKLIETENKIKTILSIQKTSGEGMLEENLKYDTFSDNSILMHNYLNRNSRYKVQYIGDVTVREVDEGVNLGNGIIQVIFQSAELRDLQGIFVGTLSNVIYVKNVTKKINLTVLDWWADYVVIKEIDKIDPADELEVSVEALQPIKMVISDVKGKIGGQFLGGGSNPGTGIPMESFDAQCVFPGNLTVGPGDLLCLLRADQKAQASGRLVNVDTYQIPYFEITRMLRIQDKIGEITDYSIVRRNEIKFNGRKPEGRFTCSFMYKPTFTVTKEPAFIRYGEDRLFPKKVMLKRYEYMSRKELRPTSAGMGSLSGVREDMF
jgi:hypothetical protein